MIKLFETYAIILRDVFDFSLSLSLTMINALVLNKFAKFFFVYRVEWKYMNIQRAIDAEVRQTGNSRVTLTTFFTQF